MWGQDLITSCTRTHIRIIPTRVGTRGASLLSCHGLSDHPHACGDQRRPEARRRSLCCIIPTRVGTRNALLYNRQQIKDHPHACGDKVYFAIAPLRITGSSPRVWGQVFIPFVFSVFIRIIPTRVGTRFLCYDILRV